MIHFNLNGEAICLDVDEDMSLLALLCDELKIKNLQFACCSGICGTCTMLVDNKPTRICNLPLYKVVGKEVTLPASAVTSE